MSTPGSRAMIIGLTVTLVSVSAAMHPGAGSFGLLLCFVGILVGAKLIAAGVRRAEVLAAFVRRNIAAVGLVMASCAFTVVSGEADPVLCFGMFALHLLGLILVNIGARGNQSVTVAAAAATATGSVNEPNS